MIIVEVKDKHGRLIERKKFRLYNAATDWYEKTVEHYGRGINISFV